MEKFISLVILSLILLLAGCSIVPKGDALREAIDRGDYEPIKEDDTFIFSIPNDHAGLFSAVKQFNIVIKGGDYKGKNASAILAKDRKTKEWVVIALFVYIDEGWVKLGAL